jgi:ribokinase
VAADAVAIAVVGNINADLSYDVPRLPQPGETLLASELRVGPGGKAGNASVAIAALGATPRLVGCLGEDPLGALVMAALGRAGVDTAAVGRVQGVTTGVATVFVAPPGEENAIVTHLGANLSFDGAATIDLSGCAAVLMTLGLPQPALLEVAAAARAAGVPLVVDATPLRTDSLPRELTAVSLLSANRPEAAALAGFPVDGDDDVDRALEALHGLGAGDVVIKLGADGAAWSDGAGSGRVEAPQVDAVDPTGAGDAFMGALVVRRAEGADLPAACAFACAAGALATTVRGAQGGFSTLDDVTALATRTAAT